MSDLNDNIKDVSAFLKTVEQEISDAKAGKMDLDTARVINRSRGLQLQAMGLQIQWQRLNRNKKPAGLAFLVPADIQEDPNPG